MRIRSFALALTLIPSLLYASASFSQQAPAGLTTVCQFSTGVRAGTSFDFAAFNVQPVPVGSPCTDGQGSYGTAIAGNSGTSMGGAQTQGSGGTMSNVTTICQFSTGPRSGTRFDFAQFGVQPVPVGAPCTDGQGSNGIAVR